MTSLEDIQAKFDFCQEELAKGLYDKIGIDETFLAGFGATMIKHCKLNCPFEIWYDNIVGFSTLKLLDRILLRRGKSPFTEEELRAYYNHTFQNVIKNSIQ